MDTLNQNNQNTPPPHTATPLTLMSEEEKKLRYFKTQLFQSEFTDEAYSTNMANLTKQIFGKKDPEKSIIESAFKEYTNTVDSNKKRLIIIDKMIYKIRTYLHLPRNTEQDNILKKKIEKYLNKINENKEAKEFKIKFDEFSKLVSCQNIGELSIEQQKKVMEAVSFLWPYERDRRKQIEIWEEDIGKIYDCLSMETSYFTKISLKDQLKTLKRIYERFFISENFEEEYERAINMQKKVWNLNNTSKKYLMKITSLFFSIKSIPTEYNQLLLSILESYKQRINELNNIYVTYNDIIQYQWSLLTKIKVELLNLSSIEIGCKKRCDVLNKMIKGEKELNPVDDVSIFIEYELLDVEFLSIMKFCRGESIYVESSSESSETSSDSINSINDNDDGSVVIEKKEKITSSSEGSDSSVNCSGESGSIVIKNKKEGLTSSSENSIAQI
ncbi:hypothetical protein EDI_343170 [Entamoeba dispar SAW760]|uniref:Uncharacterized protein n=1 Tax=Entamoeba dispar (strain ATCC PRA-260 / SAW760) TaxID=370354 RepID=B0ESV8_ENTDS|nr:uncharacterized protein EDI_343170 [Entamoeba dispar SAW760]EDR22385.1 hypothetical protein EDI_343170 [Entamoeba dispar SAW760]|eukprot:EDR22385.1 hypothetical protein EDI_343170 [Entamoeba dispar SAW760]